MVGFGNEAVTGWVGGEKARTSALALGGFALGTDGHILRDSDGEFVRVPTDVRDKVEALKFEEILVS